MDELKPARVAIIHPWMPQYRVEFFHELSRKLASKNIELEVFYGETPPEWAARQDSVEPRSFTKLRTTFIRVKGRNLSYKNLRTLRTNGPYDLLILEQAVRNLETYVLMSRKRYTKRIAFWGHGRTYTETRTAFEDKIKSKLTRRSIWFFGYTNGGVDTLVSEGHPRHATTVVLNSTDTAELKNSLREITNSELEKFKTDNNLTSNTFLYIGGVDSSKRMAFLLDAASVVHREHPEFRLIVAGSGSDAAEIQAFAQGSPFATYIGPVFGHERALAFAASKALLIPGRVGLVAVDSLVTGLPIITTDWPRHAPEFEYLEHGVTSLVTANNLTTYASQIRLVIEDPALVGKLSANCRAAGTGFSAAEMASRFAVGVLNALETELKQ